jgi:predicted flavoprotein YhiN
VASTTNPTNQTLDLALKTTSKPKKDTTPKANTRRLILIKSKVAGALDSFSPFATRNALNKAFTEKGVKGPVVATVSKTLQNNIVITTVPQFSAQYLLENQSIWEPVISF